MTGAGTLPAGSFPGSATGAAGVCAVLLVRRAARAESGLAPRLAVWGLVAASSTFNWTHAPRRPAAPEAFGLMPVVAALLFEFCLRELRLRTLADQSGRRLSALGWLHPAERIRVLLIMAASEQVPADEATRHIRPAGRGPFSKNEVADLITASSGNRRLPASSYNYEGHRGGRQLHHHLEAARG